MTPDAAMIFAAGFGTRMGSLTADTPKPMLKVGGRPMIDHAIGQLRDAGIERLVANTHYLPETLEAHLARLNVITLREEVILETGGGLRAAVGTLDCDPVITINPDVLWRGPNPVTQLCEAWHPTMSALLMLVPSEASHQSDFSLEKGEIGRSGPYRYTGLQIIRTDRLHEIEEDAFSLNTYWDLLMSSGPVHGCVYAGTWTDIGTQAALEDVNEGFGS